MIKVTGKSAVRQCTAPYIDPETREKHTITVEYYSHTQAATKQLMAAAEKEDADYQKRVEKAEKDGKPAPKRFIFGMTRSLLWVLHALPDFSTPDDKPFAITESNLDLLTFENLQAIDQAIKDDIEAKKSKPSS